MSKRGNDDEEFYERPTERTGPARRRPADEGADFSERETRPVGSRGGEEPVAGDGGNDARTRIHRPGRGRPGAHAAAAETETDVTAAGEPDDPPAGWLVIVDGPGKGRTVNVGIGANAIGRNTDQRIALAFGDDHISGESHALLVYDPQSRRFYINHGGGKNLTYLDGQLVMSPTEVQSHAEIRIGATTMRFVALCGEQFDWADT